MDLEGIMLRKGSQIEKDKYCMISHVKSKKIQQTSEYSEKRSSLTDPENKLVVINGGRGGAIQGWEILTQTSGCKIGSRVCSTTQENSQYSVITVNGEQPLQIV